MRYPFAVSVVQSTVRSSVETPSFLPSHPAAGFERNFGPILIRYPRRIRRQHPAVLARLCSQVRVPGVTTDFRSLRICSRLVCTRIFVHVCIFIFAHAFGHVYLRVCVNLNTNRMAEPRAK